MNSLDWRTVVDLFAPAIAAALIGGLVYPWVGCFLLVRRTGFYGIALPQFAAAGVAFGFLVAPLAERLTGGDSEAIAGTMAGMRYHLFWAALFTFAALLALVSLRDRGGTEAARVAAAFAIASAMTTLFAHASPAGDIYVHELLRGEILAVTTRQALGYGVTLAVVLGLLVLLRRDLVLISYDPEMAAVLSRPVRRYAILLQLLTGSAIAVGVMVIGPIVLFGLLVIPPLAARLFARSMSSFFLLASGLGLISALLGTWVSFRFDWPLGPAVVAAASLPLLAAAVARPRG